MSLYDFIFSVMRDFIGISDNSMAKYDFEDVKRELINNPVSFQEDLDELVIKVQKGEKHYLSRFIEMKKKDKEYKQLRKDCEKKDKEIACLNKELDKLNRLFVVKAYMKLRKVKRKIFNSKK